ncbi:hypothetical protein HY624_02600 [Candidatus Uhrbacteria bacterium]|nr:hypothetical protein [Candidatus Uhrbacteria bacterium]
MHYTQKQFDQLKKDGKLVIALVGMSGMGKTYRAKQLTSLGFQHLNCDDAIEKRLTALPSVGISGVAEWMGQPYTERHAARAKEYLNLEDDVVRSFLLSTSGNTVIDTTGSVVYLSDATQRLLRERALVVYLEANQEVRDKLFHVYMTDPKPVVWGNNFNKKTGESDHDALVRCYPELLAFRARRYAAIADVTLPYSTARDNTSTSDQFLKAIYALL